MAVVFVFVCVVFVVFVWVVFVVVFFFFLPLCFSGDGSRLDLMSGAGVTTGLTAVALFLFLAYEPWLLPTSGLCLRAAVSTESSWQAGHWCVSLTLSCFSHVQALHCSM